ncbi:LemA family protein [Pseudofrancisella aestuarii]|uniref:LemA family protein n=1 Tax=Pseudofrancisella aestuarii TaxID=2670347 RepID=A0ABV9TA17_9GAMM|nr:LemA family protein [Pseudofrancisella aestuarii]
MTTFIILLIIAAYLTYLYNSIISADNSAKRAWSDLVAYKRNLLKIIPKLEESISSYRNYESETLHSITKLRTSIDSLSTKEIDTSSLKETEELSKDVSTALKVSLENYPELKTDNLYIKFMKEWTDAQENITASINFFNQAVENFNNKIMQFPTNLINKVFFRKDKIVEFNDAQSMQDFSYKPNFK